MIRPRSQPGISGAGSAAQRSTDTSEARRKTAFTNPVSRSPPAPKARVAATASPTTPCGAAPSSIISLTATRRIARTGAGGTLRIKGFNTPSARDRLRSADSAKRCARARSGGASLSNAPRCTCSTRDTRSSRTPRTSRAAAALAVTCAIPAPFALIPRRLYHGATPDKDSTMTDPRTDNLPDAAKRALAEAAERRRKAKPADRPTELGGRDGPEPVRYGDWEKKGIAVDF